ncbi:MAG: DUF4922 domain-containing protein, partial [Muribaculaceae bacterium]|nr:DUF4922 domain-containing protein [Muribaculaceae bacterium]
MTAECNLSLARAVENLLEQQLTAWPLAAQNYEALRNVRVKEVPVGETTIKVQFNPSRIVSTGAKVDAKSIAERRCFLCEENRPAEQRGVDFGEYVVLVNPFPIFPRHLTIPSRHHEPQILGKRVADMAQLAKELPDYTIFYNGARCGASAPDHVHFQAGNSDFLPLQSMLEGTSIARGGN